MSHKTDKNWRILKDTSKGKYCYLIGIDSWAISMQECEFNSLKKSLNKLYEQFLNINSQLMEEELISIEITDSDWYVELEGNKSNWSLRIIFETYEDIRSFEMYWPIQIAKKLFFEMRKM